MSLMQVFQATVFELYGNRTFVDRLEQPGPKDSVNFDFGANELGRQMIQRFQLSVSVPLWFVHLREPPWLCASPTNVRSVFLRSSIGIKGKVSSTCSNSAALN